MSGGRAEIGGAKGTRSGFINHHPLPTTRKISPISFSCPPQPSVVPTMNLIQAQAHPRNDVPAPTTIPHRHHPHPPFNHADNAFDPENLAHLLDPKRKESRAKARMLTHYLTTRRVTTRSQYCQIQLIVSTKSLTSTRYRTHTINSTSSIPPTALLSPEEEAQSLEQLILSRRSNFYLRKTGDN